MDQTLSYLTAVLALGITAQLLAWRLGLPSILFLLAFGFAAGELWMRPDQIIPESLLFPIVSLSVAIILFEGGAKFEIEGAQGSGHTSASALYLGSGDFLDTHDPDCAFHPWL